MAMAWPWALGPPYKIYPLIYRELIESCRCEGNIFNTKRVTLKIFQFETRFVLKHANLTRVLADAAGTAPAAARRPLRRQVQLQRGVRAQRLALRVRWTRG